MRCATARSAPSTWGWRWHGSSRTSGRPTWPTSPGCGCRWFSCRRAYGHIERELVHYRDACGRDLVDLAGLPIANPDQPAPVRLLGTYDNVILSHANRTRIMDRAAYEAWKSPNGGSSPFLLVDGLVAGLWRADQGRIRLTPVRRLTAAEQGAVDEEVDRLEGFLAR